MMRQRQSGMTLVEVVVALMIIGIAGSTLVGLLATVSQRSSDSMYRTRSAAIATAYLDEIMAQPIAPCIGGGSRDNFRCVDHYNGIYRQPVTDRFGNTLANFPNFSVSVTINPIAVPGVAGSGGRARSIEVRVYDPANNEIVLGGLKTDHP